MTSVEMSFVHTADHNKNDAEDGHTYPINVSDEEQRIHMEKSDQGTTYESLNDESSSDPSNNSKLEMTRNPFDSNLFDKDNFPTLDGSVFQPGVKPKGDKEADGFRWSIGQLSILQPAEMDLNPYQEYSVVYETQEEEDRHQQGVDEYFKNVLLPSPWLDSRVARSSALKRVTFSPHLSTHAHTQQYEDAEEVKVEETLLSDACCQTELTFPTDLNLRQLIGGVYYSYSDESGEARQLMISSLRRKLFVQEVKTSLGGSPPSSHSASYTTSSPTRDNSPKSPALSPAEMLSPIKRSNDSTLSVFIDSPPKHGSNVGTPNFKNNLTMLSAVSPIGSGGCSTSGDDDGGESNYNFLPDVSFDFNTSGGDIRESSRDVHFRSPDISPIKNIQHDDHKIDGDTSLLDSCKEIQDGSKEDNVKESTAYNAHAFSGFDISSISAGNNSSSARNHLQQDVLDSTEIVSGEPLMPIEEDDVITEKYDVIIDQNDDMKENVAHCSSSKGLSDSRTPVTCHSDKSSMNEKTDISHHTTESPVANRLVSSDSLTTPLKGILKHRDLVTPTRTNLREFDNTQSTESNTVFNSGSKRHHLVNEINSSGKISALPMPFKQPSVYISPWQYAPVTPSPTDQSYCSIPPHVKKMNISFEEFDNKENSPPSQHLNSTVLNCDKQQEDHDDFISDPHQDIDLESMSTFSSDLTHSNDLYKQNTSFRDSNQFESMSCNSYRGNVETPLDKKDKPHGNDTAEITDLRLQRLQPGASGISPLYRLGKLHLNSANRSVKRRVQRSWSTDANTPSPTVAPMYRARSLPKYRDRSPCLGDRRVLDNVSRAYKDLLPSPLK